jgi:diguanylate cyclase (GGDEF)-like protein
LAAAALIVAGTIGAILGAQALARNDSDGSHRTFAASSDGIAATLKLAIQHEEDLSISAQAFILRNPSATKSDFAQWASDIHAMTRYPELVGLGEVLFVPAQQLLAFERRVSMNSKKPFVVTPPGNRSFYCFSVVGVGQATLANLPAGLDLCDGAQRAFLLAARDSGQNSLAPLTLEKTTTLALGIPVYRGGGVPTTIASRRLAFVGWVGMNIVPNVILRTALQGHPNTAVALSYGEGPSAVTFRSGAAARSGQSLSINLHNGWSVQISAPVIGGGIFGNTNALALLMAVIALSLLLGALIYVLGTGRSRAITLVHERTDQLRFQALHDSLTGLPNRALILDRVEQMMGRARRSNAPIAALFLDLDDFKDINDTLGHDVGDQLLAAVGARLVEALREGDTVGRLGGDEFVVLVEGASLAAGAEVVAQRILDVLGPPFELSESDLPLSISASIGIATGDRPTSAELLRDADIALYRAKGAGKHCAVVFAPSMQAATEDHRHLNVDLHAALEAKQFFLLYQPTIDLSTNEFTGVEALLRWSHPERGIVQPDDFISALETSGLIVPVGAWVLEEACRQGALWRDQGHRFTISVNVSAKQLERDRIIDDVASALAKSHFDPANLILELTETALMRDVEETIIRLGLLKALGVQLAIDDFGTGYSSLAYLQQFPIDVLKIDRSFVSGIADSAESAALVHTLVQLGKVLGLQTIAEGIEYPEQRELLQAENVDVGQGFLFSRPLDAEAMGLFLKRSVEKNLSIVGVI